MTLDHAIIVLAVLAAYLSPTPSSAADESLEKPVIDIETSSDATAVGASISDDLPLSQLDKFQPGQPKDEVLASVQWRGTLEMAGYYKGKSAYVISYGIVPDETGRQKPAWAIFIDEKFWNFVVEHRGWQSIPESPRDAAKMSDCTWIARQMQRERISAVELKEEFEHVPPPRPRHVDPGLTAVFIILSPFRRGQTEEEFAKRIRLRDRFNASRLRLGMTEPEVKSAFNAEPIELGSGDDVTYKIYGTEEVFNFLSPPVSNVLVVFRGGELIAVHRAPAGIRGWRDYLGKVFTDLPNLKSPADPAGAKEGEKGSELFY